MAHNPFAVIVPCHRVLAANQKIGGFSAPGSIETKLKMLAIERDALLRAHRPVPFAFDPDEAVAHLRKSDPALRSLIDRVGAFSMKLDPAPSLFTALAQAIIYQQLTAKAAETIWLRFLGLFPFCVEGPDPALVAKASHKTLRSAGLSTAKTLAIADLAKKCVHHELPTLEQLYSLDDATVIERLTCVRGVGRWTVEMLLMFRLGRPDVLPVNDYGLKKGFQRTFGGELPSKSAMLARSQAWAPFRTVASWYLWRANDLTL
jgi:3-methyladenine DNA glycosylase/8-oxoguanine DNA glycosylase